MESKLIEAAFKSIMEERVFKVALTKAAKDMEFIEADKKRDGLFADLKGSLTNKTQHVLLDELESAWNILEYLGQEYAYRQGVEDSPKLHQELSRFGIKTYIQGGV